MKLLIVLFAVCALTSAETPEEAAQRERQRPKSCCEDRNDYNYCPMLCPDAIKKFGLTPFAGEPTPVWWPKPKTSTTTTTTEDPVQAAQRERQRSVSCCEDRNNYNYCPMLCPEAYKEFGLTWPAGEPTPSWWPKN